MRSRSRENLKCGHFTLLFCRGRQRNVPKCKTHVQSVLQQTRCSVVFSLPLPSLLLKLPKLRPGKIILNPIQLTVQRMAWYLINILTIFTVPCACLISCNVGCALFVQRNRLGAMIIATLFNPILLCFSWATTRLKKWTRIWQKVYKRLTLQTLILGRIFSTLSTNDTFFNGEYLLLSSVTIRRN